MAIIIEPVKKSELQILANISRQTFYDTFWEQNTKENMDMFLEQSFNLQKLDEELNMDSNYFFFARMEDEVVGYLKLSEGDIPPTLGNVDALEIVRIYAVSKKIGAGVGKAMFEFALTFAKQKQKEIVWLGVWEHNVRAINFYKKFGFEKFDEHVFMVGDDPQNDWLFKRELNQ